MAVLISDEIVQSTHMTDNELRTEIAVMLFEKDKLTLRQAARVSGMQPFDFQRLLGSRNIPIHYDVEDFDSDVTNMKRAGEL